MMQAADARQRDQTRRLARLGGNRPYCRCVFLKRVMDPVRMIIGDVIADQTTQMSIIEDERRTCSMTKKQYKNRNVRVGTVKKSMAAMISR